MQVACMPAVHTQSIPYHHTFSSSGHLDVSRGGVNDCGLITKSPLCERGQELVHGMLDALCHGPLTMLGSVGTFPFCILWGPEHVTELTVTDQRHLPASAPSPLPQHMHIHTAI